MPKVGWGHSTYDVAIEVALKAGAKVLVLGHLEPARNDVLVDKLFDSARTYLDEMLRQPEHAGKSLEVMMAYEGLEHRLM